MLLAGLLDEGAGELDAQAFQRALDEKAIEISFHSDRDAMSGRMRTLVKNLDRAAELLRLAINQPRFDEEPFIRVRENANARLRHDANDPGSMAAKAWKASAFPATLRPADRRDARFAGADRAGRSRRGGEAAPGAPSACRRGRRGDQRKKRGRACRQGLRRSAGQGRSQARRPGRVRWPRQDDAIPLDVPESTIRFGRPGLMRDHPDYIASVVAAHVLGGSGNMTSRLFREVREKAASPIRCSAISTPTTTAP